MKKNFKVVDGIAIQFENFYLDLHNDYDVININIKIEEQTIVKLLFNKLNEKWVNKENPSSIVLEFEGLENLDFSENLFTTFSNTIEEIGYKDKNDKDYDWIQSESQSNIESNIFFRFENDGYIKIYSQSAILRLITT
jgi:hypothetical protein